VNPKDVALPARYQHVVAKCALMVERNPVVVRCDAPIHERPRRGVLCINIDPEDKSAYCDENVARAEEVIRRPGGRWDRSHVFFPAGTKPRNAREERDSSIAVDLIDLIVAVWGHEQKIRRSGHARGKGDIGKENWSGGVKRSCDR